MISETQQYHNNINANNLDLRAEMISVDIVVLFFKSLGEFLAKSLSNVCCRYLIKDNFPFIKQNYLNNDFDNIGQKSD